MSKYKKLAVTFLIISMLFVLMHAFCDWFLPSYLTNYIGLEQLNSNSTAPVILLSNISKISDILITTAIANSIAGIYFIYKAKREEN